MGRNAKFKPDEDILKIFFVEIRDLCIFSL